LQFSFSNLHFWSLRLRALYVVRERLVWLAQGLTAGSLERRDCFAPEGKDPVAKMSLRSKKSADVQRPDRILAGAHTHKLHHKTGRRTSAVPGNHQPNQSL
jgi:hypothetical protein